MTPTRRPKERKSRSYGAQLQLSFGKGWGREMWTTFLFFWPRCAVCRILAPQIASNPCPLRWKHGVLTTRPPGKSLDLVSSPSGKHRAHSSQAATNTILSSPCLYISSCTFPDSLSPPVTYNTAPSPLPNIILRRRQDSFPRREEKPISKFLKWDWS